VGEIIVRFDRTTQRISDPVSGGGNYDVFPD
jgi:hypothetical protein